MNITVYFGRKKDAIIRKELFYFLENPNKMFKKETYCKYCMDEVLIFLTLTVYMDITQIFVL
jgi:hypothetical protein